MTLALHVKPGVVTLKSMVPIALAPGESPRTTPQVMARAGGDVGGSLDDDLEIAEGGGLADRVRD